MPQAKVRKVPSIAALKSLSFFLSFLLEYKWRFMLALLGLFLTAALSLGFPWLLAAMVARVIDLSGSKLAHLQGAAPGMLQSLDSTQILYVIFAVLALQSVLVYLRIRALSSAVERALNRAREALYQRVMHLPLADFFAFRAGELSGRLSGDLALMRTTLMETLPQLVRTGVSLIGSGLVIIFTSTRLAGFSLLVLPLVVALIGFFARRIRRYSKAAQDQLAEANVAVEQGIAGIVEVKAFANEQFECDKHASCLQRYLQATLRAASMRGLFVAFIVFAMMGTIAVVVWKGLDILASGQISSEEFTRFLLFSIFVAASFAALPEIMGQLNRGVGACERLVELAKQQPEHSGTHKARRLRGDIVFEQLSFSYPGRKASSIFNNLQLHIPAGQRVALVGASGAGKSTLVKLLLAMYKPDEGRVLIDGLDVESYDKQSLRRNMALVSQEVALFAGSIAENIAYGNLTADLAQIRRAANLAQADEFITALPEGYDTQVGPRGMQLSGGQRQRVAIARALLADAPILLLDEATSALDSHNEQLLQAGLEQLMQGRSALVIAHRLATVRACDRILVMQQGRIVEDGSHQQLMEMPEGVYRGMVQAQML